MVFLLLVPYRKQEKEKPNTTSSFLFFPSVQYFASSINFTFASFLSSSSFYSLLFPSSLSKRGREKSYKGKRNKLSVPLSFLEKGSLWDFFEKKKENTKSPTVRHTRALMCISVLQSFLWDDSSIVYVPLLSPRSKWKGIVRDKEERGGEGAFA